MVAMRARSAAEVTCLAEAHARLGLTRAADASARAAAFRAAVKAAHASGDEDRLRLTIAAWRLIQSEAVPPALAAPADLPPRQSPLVITPVQALNGARIEARVGERLYRLTLPPGLRTGEHVRLTGAGADGAALYLPVLIRPADGLAALGDDLYMSLKVSPRLLAEGGRLEVETPAGPRSLWLTPDHPTHRLVIPGLGLPARGKRPQGRLFVTLEPAAEAPSPAEVLLERFSRRWTAEPLAA